MKSDSCARLTQMDDPRSKLGHFFCELSPFPVEILEPNFHF